MDSDGSGNGIYLYLIISMIFIFINYKLIIYKNSLKFINEDKLSKIINNKNLKSLQSNIEIKKFIDDISIASITSYTIIAVFMTIPSFTIMIQTIKYNSPIIIAFYFIAYIIIISIFLNIFCYSIPNLISTNKSEKIIKNGYKTIKYILILFFPLIKIINFSTYITNIIFKIESKKNTTNSHEEDILMIVNDGNKQGFIENTQKEMINNIFEFDDITAHDIMTHRTDIIAIEEGSCISDIVNISKETGFSRIPIYKNDIDNIIGVVYIKDLIHLIGQDNFSDKNITPFIKNLIYLPESIKCTYIFKEFSIKKIHMAVIIDNFGGTSGIISMEDLLEEIVGNIQDEHDHEDSKIKKISENSFIIKGDTEIDHIIKILGANIPKSFDNISEFLINKIDKIPENNEQITILFDNFKFTVIQVIDRRIEYVKAIKI